MITLEQFNNNAFSWLYNLEDIIIGQADSMMVEVMVDRNITIFKELLYAEDDGNIVLRNLPDLLEPYFDNNTKITVDINNFESEVFFSRRFIPRLLDKQFADYLPMLMNVSSTFFATLNEDVNIPILLPANYSDTKVICECYGLDDHGYLYVESIDLSINNNSNSPEVNCIVLAPKELFSSKIMRQFIPYGMSISINGTRIANVCLVNDDNQITLEFLNNFNQLTKFTIPGTLQYKPDYNRIITKIFGQSRTILVKEEIIHTFLCGPIDHEAISQLMDAASSNLCRFIDKEGKSYDIVLDKPEIEYSKGNSEFVTPKFTFTRSCTPAALINKI